MGETDPVFFKEMQSPTSETITSDSSYFDAVPSTMMYLIVSIG